MDLDDSPSMQFAGSDLPESVLRPQITIHIGVVADRPGGCQVTFEALPESPLVVKHGSAIKVIAACREVIVGELDELIANFIDEE